VSTGRRPLAPEVVERWVWDTFRSGVELTAVLSIAERLPRLAGRCGSGRAAEDSGTKGLRPRVREREVDADTGAGPVWRGSPRRSGRGGRGSHELHNLDGIFLPEQSVDLPKAKAVAQMRVVDFATVVQPGHDWAWLLQDGLLPAGAGVRRGRRGVPGVPVLGRRAVYCGGPLTQTRRRESPGAEAAANEKGTRSERLPRWGQVAPGAGGTGRASRRAGASRDRQAWGPPLRRAGSASKAGRHGLGPRTLRGRHPGVARPAGRGAGVR